MAKDYVMPKLAMAMNEGTINQWLVHHGQVVEVGQPLMSVETEKVAYDCESPEAGYICLLVAEGETVRCETVVARFCESPEELQQLAANVSETGDEAGQVSVNDDSSHTAAPPLAAGNSSGRRIKASPLAKKMAADAGLDLQGLQGSGPGGRIVKRDVLAALESGAGIPVRGVAGGEKARIPMTGIRKTIAGRMVESLQTAAQLSSSWESDITGLLVLRGKFLEREEQLGTRVSVNAFIIKAIACAVRDVPMANASLEGDEIAIHNAINMGIAISMPGQSDYDSALVVAVLHNVEQLGLVEIDKAMKSLVARVRAGEASAQDMSGSTITLSSTAGIGPPGLKSTPVLNLPNAVLLGPSTPLEKPVVYKGEIIARTMMPLSMTFDHRILDGEPAARFMKALHDYLEFPELMLARGL